MKTGETIRLGLLLMLMAVSLGGCLDYRAGRHWVAVGDRISTSGSSSRHWANSAASRDCGTPSDSATRSLPRNPAAAPLTLALACSTTAKIRRASSSSTLPAQVRRVRRVVRSNSCTPSLYSRSLMMRDRGDCSICNRAAARAKCSSSANDDEAAKVAKLHGYYLPTAYLRVIGYALLQARPAGGAGLASAAARRPGRPRRRWPQATR